MEKKIKNIFRNTIVNGKMVLLQEITIVFTSTWRQILGEQHKNKENQIYIFRQMVLQEIENNPEFCDKITAVLSVKCPQKIHILFWACIHILIIGSNSHSGVYHFFIL